MRYKIVEADSAKMLEFYVEKELKRGWKLLGSPFFAYRTHNPFCQAMTMED